jgi:hypothetical protein
MNNFNVFEIILVSIKLNVQLPETLLQFNAPEQKCHALYVT